MPMPIYTRVIVSSGIVEMDGANVFQADVFFERLHRSLESVLIPNIVACSKGMRGVKADAKIQIATCSHNCSKVFEDVANTCPLACGIFQQNPKLAKFQAL